MKRLRNLVLPVLLASITVGCIAVGGTSRTQPPTLGKELTDLKCAHENGAINDAEYQTAKANLLSGKRTDMGH